MIQAPFIYTDVQDGSTSGTQYADLVRHGWKGIVFQAQNDTLVRDFDLRVARAAGLSPGVWGCTYDAANFFRDGKVLGQQAVKLGADFVHVDCEFAAKNTRGGGMKPIIDGLRAGGWQGSVSLNTFGAPSNPRTAENPNGNDFAMDVESFLAAGGGVICQAYLNENDVYDPKLCVAYWRAVGVPADKINVMIELAPAPPGAQYQGRRLAGSQWLPYLGSAGATTNVSVFMWQHTDPADLDALDALTLAPTPVRVPTTAETRKKIWDAAIAWEAALHRPDERYRITTCRRIAGPDNTNERWGMLIEGVPLSRRIADLLDRAGIPA
jgi:hypothetical protein